MRLATWNVNSVKARLPRLLEWLAETEPDIVGLQETKCAAALFPAAEVEELGYQVAAHGDGRWNGVALLSRVGLQDVSLGLPGEPGYEGESAAPALIDDARPGSPGRIWPAKNTIRLRIHKVRIISPRRLNRNVAIAGLLHAGPPRAERSRAAQPSSVIDG